MDTTLNISFSDTEQEILERLKADPQGQDMFWEAHRLSIAYVSQGGGSNVSIDPGPALNLSPDQTKLFKAFAAIAIRDHRYRDAAASRLAISAKTISAREAAYC